MLRSLKIFGEKLKLAPLTKRSLADQCQPNRMNLERVLTIHSIEEFNKKITTSDSPVIVNFSAEWCFNCKTLLPLIETIVHEHSRKMLLLKVDVDQHPELALSYNLTVVPVLIGINKGEAMTSLTGMHKVEEIRNWVEAFLAKT